jgi:hypothetical protein
VQGVTGPQARVQGAAGPSAGSSLSNAGGLVTRPGPVAIPPRLRDVVTVFGGHPDSLQRFRDLRDMPGGRAAARGPLAGFLNAGGQQSSQQGDGDPCGKNGDGGNGGDVKLVTQPDAQGDGKGGSASRLPDDKSGWASQDGGSHGYERVPGRESALMQDGIVTESHSYTRRDQTRYFESGRTPDGTYELSYIRNERTGEASVFATLSRDGDKPKSLYTEYNAEGRRTRTVRNPVFDENTGTYVDASTLPPPDKKENGDKKADGGKKGDAGAPPPDSTPNENASGGKSGGHHGTWTDPRGVEQPLPGSRGQNSGGTPSGPRVNPGHPPEGTVPSNPTRGGGGQGPLAGPCGPQLDTSSANAPATGGSRGPGLRAVINPDLEHLRGGRGGGGRGRGPAIVDPGGPRPW